MKIRVVAFASAADALGAAARELELPAGAGLAALGERLCREHPGIAPLWPRLALAVDGEVRTGETALADGCEVALLPPVSGG